MNMEREASRFSLCLFVLFMLLIIGLLSLGAHAQESDIFVSACATQDACTLQSNVPWSVGSRTWRFTAKYPNESIRVWIRNQNTTSAHTGQAISIFITDDKTATSLLTQADRWLQAGLVDNTISGASCTSVAANRPTSSPGANGKASCYAIAMFAVQIAVRITNTTAAAGSPDQFDIGIVQQDGNNASGPQPGLAYNDSTNGVTLQKELGTFDTSISPVTLNCVFGTTGSVAPCVPGLSLAVNLTGFGAGPPMGIVSGAAGATETNPTYQEHGTNAVLSEKGGRWSITAAPATGAAFTATEAGSAGTIHVADCLSYSVFDTTAPAAASTDSVEILDGATIIWRLDFTQPAAISNTAQGSICGLNRAGTSGNAMSCTATNATANASHSCSLSGYDVQ